MPAEHAQWEDSRDKNTRGETYYLKWRLLAQKGSNVYALSVLLSMFQFNYSMIMEITVALHMVHN